MQQDIREKLKRLSIISKRLTRTSLAGDYLSAFKGSGIEFDQLREYQPGDDVRLINWHSTAKTGKLMIKEFIEERDRTVILMVDVSGSGHFSSKQELKQELTTQVAAAITFVAQGSKDRIGALLFSDQVEKWIPPKKGNAHAHTILEALLSIKPQGTGTDIAAALRFLVERAYRNAIVFMLSDWIDDPAHYRKMLGVARLKFDCIGIRLLDKCEKELPDVGFLEVIDPETGEQGVLDTRGMKKINKQLRERLAQQDAVFGSYHVDMLDLEVGRPFVSPLIQFFHKRIRRSI